MHKSIGWRQRRRERTSGARATRAAGVVADLIHKNQTSALMTILYPLYARGNRGRAADLLLFASNYPHWSTMDAGGLFPEAAAADRGRLLAGNAPDFYPRLRAAAAA